MTSGKVHDHVPYHVKEEWRRWNAHLDRHKKKIDKMKPTIDKNGKAIEMLDQLKRSSAYQSEQRASTIHLDNLKLRRKLNEIGGRDDELSRNCKFYEKQKSHDRRLERDGGPSLNFMKSVREKERKDISEEKNKLEDRINMEQKKQRQLSKHNVHKDRLVADSSVHKKENVENMRPNVSAIKFSKDRKKTKEIVSYVPPWQRPQVKKKEENEADKVAGIGKQRSKDTHRKKVKRDRELKGNEEDVQLEHIKTMSDQDMLDGGSTYHDNENYYDIVVDGSNDNIGDDDIDHTNSHGSDTDHSKDETIEHITHIDVSIDTDSSKDEVMDDITHIDEITNVINDESLSQLLSDTISTSDNEGDGKGEGEDDGKNDIDEITTSKDKDDNNEVNNEDNNVDHQRDIYNDEFYKDKSSSESDNSFESESDSSSSSAASDDFSSSSSDPD